MRFYCLFYASLILFYGFIHACPDWRSIDDIDKSYISTDSVTSVDLNQVCPVIDDNKIPGGTASYYLSDSSCLGYAGPIGPHGPLGMLGPIGNNSWNVSGWMQALGDWSSWQDSNFKGVFDKEGPLGYKGPLSVDQYYGLQDPGKSLFNSNDFAVQLRVFGLWSVLGPLGPLGALGPLGPLGPLGGYSTIGLSINSNGEYTKDNRVVRTVTVLYDDSTNRDYELFENYKTSKFAKCVSNQDTSFMVISDLFNSFDIGHVDYYPINSNQDQFVTILLMPSFDLDNWDLAVYDDSGKLIAASEATTTIDFLILNVSGNTKFYVAARLTSKGMGYFSAYRLFVVGGTSYINKTNSSGNHIENWYDDKYSKGNFPTNVSIKVDC